MKTWIQAIVIAAILVGCSPVVHAQKADALMGMGAEPYAWISGQTPVNKAPALKPKQLLGHVVAVITFGAGCNRCKQFQPELVAFTNTMRSRGGIVIGSHVHSVDQEATAFFQRLNFPIYQRLTQPDAKIQGDMPIVTVYDKSGTIAVKGVKWETAKEDFQKTLPELFNQPAPIVETSRTTPYALVDNPLAGENFGESGAKLSAMFKPGAAWGKGCKMLAGLAKSRKDDSDMYESMITTVNDYVRGKIGDMESIVSDKPAEALSTLLILDKSTKGMEINKEIKEMVSDLTKENKSASELAKIFTHIAEYDIQFDNLPEKKQQKEGSKLVSTLTKFAERKNVDDTLKAEAENAVALVKALMDGSATEIDTAGGGNAGNFGEAADDDKAEKKASKKDKDDDDKKADTKRGRKKDKDEDAAADDDDDDDSKAGKAGKKKSSRRSSSRKSKAAADDDDSDDLFGGDDDSGSKKKSSRSSRSRRNKN